MSLSVNFGPHSSNPYTYVYINNKTHHYIQKHHYQYEPVTITCSCYPIHEMSSIHLPAWCETCTQPPTCNVFWGCMWVTLDLICLCVTWLWLGCVNILTTKVFVIWHLDHQTCEWSHLKRFIQNNWYSFTKLVTSALTENE